MLEIVMIIGLCVVMSRVADMEGRSPAAWGVITAGLCILSLFIDLPLLRILLAGFVAFVAMIVAKVMASR